jgi:hypothetical protein
MGYVASLGLWREQIPPGVVLEACGRAAGALFQVRRQLLEMLKARRFRAPAQILEMPERFPRREVDATVDAFHEVLISIDTLANIGVVGIADGTTPGRDDRRLTHVSETDVARGVP